MNPTQALIIAGGRGTRMGSSLPKPLVRIGSTTLIELAMARVVHAGVRELYFAIGHGAEQVRTHVERVCPPEVESKWLAESTPRGTIGSLGDLAATGRTTLVSNGDLFSDLDLGELLAGHHAGRADITIAVHTHRHRLDFGEVVADADGRVRAYKEKPEKHYRLSSGMYAFEPSAAALIQPGESLGVPILIQRALDAGLEIRAHSHDALWLDVNDRATLARATELYDSHRDRFPSPTEVLKRGK